MLEKQKKTISELHVERSQHLAKISGLNDDVIQLNSRLEHLKKQVKMMTTGTNVLEGILEGKNQGKPEAICFNYKVLNKKQRNKNSSYALEDFEIFSKQKIEKDTKFIATEGTGDHNARKQILQHHEEHQSSKSKGVYNPWVCHYSGRNGHIKPYCFKMYGYPNRFQQKIHDPKVIIPKKELKPKLGVGLIAHTSLRALSIEN